MAIAKSVLNAPNPKDALAKLSASDQDLFRQAVLPASTTSTTKIVPVSGGSVSGGGV
jgi:hypothetical protein